MNDADNAPDRGLTTKQIAAAGSPATKAGAMGGWQPDVHRGPEAGSAPLPLLL